MTTEHSHALNENVEPNAKDKQSKRLTLIGVGITAVTALVGVITIAVLTQPYSGSGVVQSHVPFSAYVCALTVQQDDGKVVTYEKTTEAPYCEGVVDGSKVEIKDGKIV